MNDSGRGNWILMFGLLIVGMMVFVGAVSWDGTANDVTYNATEDTSYYHNFTTNITDPTSDMDFSVDIIDTTILWNGNTINYSQISDWIYFVNITTGNFTLNATHTNQTGNFSIPIKVTWDSGASAQTTTFNFNITSVNDAPTFTELTDGETDQFNENSVNLITQYNATDEEGEYDGTGYPLNFNSNITWCNSSINTTDCNNLFNLSLVGNNSAELNISRTNDYVGHYNITFWVNDSVSQTEINVTFEIINVNDAPNITFACDNNRDMVEDEIMSCWINATDVDENNNLTFVISSDLAQFTFNDSTTSYLYSCSGGGDCNASANVTFILNDFAVGNWSVNISITDTGEINTVDWANFSFFVNNTEDNVSIVDIVDFTKFEGSEHKFNVTAYDDDLLVPQSAVKLEALTFTSNNTDIIYDFDTQTVSDNKSTIIAYINWTYATENNITNASIKINVTDRLGISGPEIYSFDETIFLITFDDDNSAPVWNESAIYDFLIQEDNSSWGGVNLSGGYVSDSDEENITFYYTNDTRFDNFNLSNSSGNWIINFTPDDVDVGYHNITIIASDGNVNVTHEFNFTVSNIADDPEIHSLSNTTIEIEDGNTIIATENTEIIFELVINDLDFLIPDYQIETYDFYNESLTINVTATNSSNIEEDLFEFSFVEFEDPNPQSVSYNASFTPTNDHVDNYTIIVNITDNSSVSTSITFYLNISDVPNDPVLGAISNHSLTIHDYLNFTVNAADEEDGTDLNYSIANLSVNSPNITIGVENGSIEFNMSSNNSYAGMWRYNITVTDSSDRTDSQIFYLYVYGNPNITLPVSNHIFNWTESNATGNLIFNVSHAVNNTNLTYKIYIDKIVYYNATHFNYTNLTTDASLRNETNFTLTFENNFTWNYTSTYTDETYGMLKNLTLIVINPDYPELNDSVNWKINISHTNQNVSFSGNPFDIQNVGPISEGSSTTINLTSYFSDVDYWDKNISQVVNFTINHFSGSSLVSAASSIDSNWILTLTISGDISSSITETINLTAFEWNDSSISIGNATSNIFNVTFDPATTTTTPVPTSGGGGGSKTKLKHFSLKLVVPQDIIISDKNFIDIPFMIQNNGQMDLKGINLSSFVKFNDLFTDDVRISLGDNYIDELKFGQSENFTMRITANTQRAGKYKATILAEVASPKLSDWGDFFIEIKKANESEAEQILIFTEKIISDNPECLELTELLRRAETAFALGEYSNAMSLGQEAIEACEDAIKANEQIRYKIEGAVKDNFYYISFATLAIFFIGLMFYIYKRVRFNKYKTDEYV